jgi:hypothetical protein
MKKHFLLCGSLLCSSFIVASESSTATTTTTTTATTTVATTLTSAATRTYIFNVLLQDGMQEDAAFYVAQHWPEGNAIPRYLPAKPIEKKDNTR